MFSTEPPLFSNTNSSNLSASVNTTNVIPENLTFSIESKIEVSAYVIIFIFSAFGNVTIFLKLFRNRHRKTRLNIMMLHLITADLIVTFIMIPMEIAWRITVQWHASNFVCKIMMILRAFGLYLSSMVVVCISFERHFAIVHPLRSRNYHQRGKIMLIIAWFVSFTCSIPQGFVFNVLEHPEVPGYWQCVTFTSFPNEDLKMTYNICSLLVLYGIPLVIIAINYTSIFLTISKNSNQNRGSEEVSSNKCPRTNSLALRRSDTSSIDKAKKKTMRLTTLIVTAFVSCWTPYSVMTLLHMVNREVAESINENVQRFIFMFAVSNSLINPIIYGSCVINFKDEIRRLLRPICVHLPFMSKKSSHFAFHKEVGRQRTSKSDNSQSFSPKNLVVMTESNGSVQSSLSFRERTSLNKYNMLALVHENIEIGSSSEQSL